MSDSTARRLTELARNAAELLRTNGFAWGPAVAIGTQLTLDGALAIAAEVPGDDYVVERQFARHSELEELRRGARVLPDAFAPGAAEARVDYLARLEITDRDLHDHFGEGWLQVLALNSEIVTIPYATWLERAGSCSPVKTAPRNNAWVAVRAHARERGRYRQWLDARVLVSLYFQAFLTSPDVDRPPNSSDLWTAWDVAETIAKDAMAVVALGEDSPDSVLAAHLDRLNAPWRAVTGSEDDRLAYAEVVLASGAVEDRPAPVDYEPDIDDYDLSVEDPVIDGDAPVTAEDFRRDAM